MKHVAYVEAPGQQLPDSPIHKPALQSLPLQVCCSMMTGDAQPR